MAIRIGEFWAAVALLAIGLSIAWYSRIAVLFREPIPTMGLAAIALSVLLIAVIPLRKRYSGYLAIIIAFGFLVSLWIVQFGNNFSMPLGWRALANYSGIFLGFAFLFLIERYGLTKALHKFYLLCLAYVAIYCVLGALITNMGWFSAYTSAVLRDGARGLRLYSNGAVLAFVLFYQIAALKNPENRKGLGRWVGIALTLTAIMLAQSRVSMALYLAFSLLLFMGWHRAMLGLLSAFVLSFLFVTLTLLVTPDVVLTLTAWLDASFLAGRVNSFGLASEVFQQHPILGLGIPEDPSSYWTVLGGQFIPDDLGPLGIASAYGIAGVAWVTLLLIAIRRSAKAAIASLHPGMIAVAYSGAYIAFYTSISPSIMQSDGSILVGLLLTAAAASKTQVDREPVSAGTLLAA